MEFRCLLRPQWQVLTSPVWVAVCAAAAGVVSRLSIRECGFVAARRRRSKTQADLLCCMAGKKLMLKAVLCPNLPSESCSSDLQATFVEIRK